MPGMCWLVRGEGHFNGDHDALHPPAAERLPGRRMRGLGATGSRSGPRVARVLTILLELILRPEKRLYYGRLHS